MRNQGISTLSSAQITWEHLSCSECSWWFGSLSFREGTSKRAQALDPPEGLWVLFLQLRTSTSCHQQSPLVFKSRTTEELDHNTSATLNKWLQVKMKKTPRLTSAHLDSNINTETGGYIPACKNTLRCITIWAISTTSSLLPAALPWGNSTYSLTERDFFPPSQQW